MSGISASALRNIQIVLGGLLVLGALTRLLLVGPWRDKPRLERFLCHTFRICDDDGLRERAFNRTASERAAAIEDFQELVRRDPASAYRWYDLGQAFLAAGQVENARGSISRALELGPHSAPILKLGGAFYFDINKPMEGFQCMSRVLSKSEEHDADIFSTYDRLGGGIDNILNYGLPPEPRPAKAFFHHLLGKGEVPGIQKTWQWLSSHSLTDDKLACEYIDFLLKNHEYETAMQAWTRQLGGRQGDYRFANELFNGGFEAETTGTTFDWKIGQVSGAEVGRDASIAQQGHGSLRVHFDGKENLAYNHIAQRTVVGPGNYQFEAWVRTEEISTDQGIGWRIFDVESPSRLNVEIGNQVGTGDWTKVEKTFSVPAETRLVEIQLIRRRSLKFDNKVSGTAWIDGVSLRQRM